MATITFAPTGDSTPIKTAAVVVAEPTALAVVEPQQIVSSPRPPSGIDGEITQEDLRVPRINLVQKSGQLCDNFSPGSFLFEKSIVIAKPGSFFTVVPLRLRKYYQEKLEFGSSNEMPRRANTAQEVRELGGSTMWGHENYFQDMADIMLAVEAPESLDEDAMQYFGYSHGGKNYGLAIYTVGSSAYTTFARRLITDTKGVLKGYLFNGKYELNSEIKKNGSNSWYVPMPKFAGKNSPEECEFFRGLSGL